MWDLGRQTGGGGLKEKRGRGGYESQRESIVGTSEIRRGGRKGSGQGMRVSG